MKSYKIIYIVLAISTLAQSCSKDRFAEYNTDPDAVLALPVEYLFTRAIIQTHDNDGEAFYDNYNYVSRWSRVFLQRTGNSFSVVENAANANNRYGKYFEDIGPLLVDIQKTIDAMPEDEKARNIYKRTIPTILNVYGAWYVSDVNGSIPYTEAFQARYGGTLRPVYQTQSQLYEIFDTELKEAASILSSPQPVEQFSYGDADIYFGGDPAKWAKAANSLRLMIALRLSKRDPQRLQTIVQDVLSHPAGLIESAEDSWQFNARPNFTSGGNWNITGNGRLFVGEHGVVDYMWNNQDPRLRIFFRPNQWSEENFQRAKDQGVIPQSAFFDNRRFYGQYSNPDAAEDPLKVRFFAPLQIADGDNMITLDTVSRIQDRLFQPENNGGSGVGIFPIITYADLCFIRAEIAQRGWSNENAKEWYEKAVKASLEFYNNLGNKTQIYDYVSINEQEITTFLNHPDIKYNHSTGLEQIILQAYLNYFRNFNEAWALVKRTGMPNENTRLVFERWTNQETVLEMPRRYPVNYPVTGEYNFENKKAAIDEMAKDPDFGEPSSLQGRVWWDKKN